MTPEAIVLAPGEGKSLSAHGAGFVLKAGATDTAGGFSYMERTIPANVKAPPQHVHASAEAFYVLQGWITFHLGERVEAVGGGGDKNGTAPPTGDAKTIADLTKGKANTLTVVSVQPSLARPGDRLSLALLPTGAGAGAGETYKGGTARAWVATSQTEPFVGPVDLTYHGEGFERGVYVGRVDFATEGQWLVYVEAKPENASTTLNGGSTLVVGNAPQQPGQKPQPVPGDTAISTPTPTTKDARGVNPICTRVNAAGTREICSMHTISLDEALKNPKPTVLVIGTPAFCTSRFCGPIVDQLMLAQKDFAATVDFVHIEQYVDDKDAPATGKLAPAAAAYHLEAEPVVYYIRPDGTIDDWTIGASDAPEMRALTKTLL